MISPERLAGLLRESAVLLEAQGPVAWARTKGELTWQRADDWENAVDPRLHVPEPGDEEDAERIRLGRSALEEEDRKGDAAAARYKQELDRLSDRIAADLARLSVIVSVCCPPAPSSLKSMELLNAQVAAEGWCVSCWRVDQTVVEAAKGRYKGLCRKCGEFKAAEGVIPPKQLLERALSFGWSKVTTADVARALGRAS